jgi:enoyl-CoA hydratase/carnithine racemase
MYARVSEALEEANEDNAIRCILITGSDTAFTAGNDLKEFLSDPPVAQDAPVFRMLRALVANEKVLIAAVNGLAVGIGTTMLLHCDLVVAVTDARFQLPFINLAIVPEAASSLLLPRLIGHQRTMELLLLGEPFTVETAQSYGLVNRVVASEELLPTARALAAQILRKPPKALHLLKRLVVGDADVVLTRIKEEGVALGAQLASQEGKEAVAALIEKRPPIFDFS